MTVGDFPEQQSVWTATTRQVSPSQRLAGDLESDVAVIGAGFTGLRAALQLADSDASTVVLEAGDVGWGASGRSGGQVNPLPPFDTPSRLQRIVGADRFDGLVQTFLKSADELFSLVEASEIDCQARQNGWLRMLHDRRRIRAAAAEVEEWNAVGAEMRLVEGRELEVLAGSNAYRAGVLNRRGGAVHPLMLARGMARAARRKQVRIFGRSPALRLEETGDRWTVHTASGRVSADCVIVATNAYTDSLVPGLTQSIFPVSPIQIATDPLPEDVVGGILPRGHTISDSRRLIMYARREPDNRIVYGGIGRTTSGGRLAGFESLMRDAARVFPQLRDVDWPYRWGGRIAMTKDRLPHLHEPRKGLLIGLGYNGRGVAMSNVMGRVLADRALGAPPETLPFPIRRIGNFPYRRIRKLATAPAIHVMRMLDSVEFR